MNYVCKCWDSSLTEILLTILRLQLFSYVQFYTEYKNMQTRNLRNFQDTTFGSSHSLKDFYLELFILSLAEVYKKFSIVSFISFKYYLLISFREKSKPDVFIIIMMLIKIWLTTFPMYLLIIYFSSNEFSDLKQYIIVK